MNQTNHGFRERLLKAEQVTPALRERYEKEIQVMFQKQILGIRRWSFFGGAIMGIAFALLFGGLAVMLPAEFPWWGRLIFAVGALFGIGWAVLGIRVFRRRSLDLKVDTRAYYGMAWGLPVIITTVALVAAPENLIGLRMIVTCLAFLIGGAAFLLRGVVEESELKTREKLLEIEYQLAELTEHLKSR